MLEDGDLDDLEVMGFCRDWFCFLETEEVSFGLIGTC